MRQTSASKPCTSCTSANETTRPWHSLAICSSEAFQDDRVVNPRFDFFAPPKSTNIKAAVSLKPCFQGIAQLSHLHGHTVGADGEALITFAFLIQAERTLNFVSSQERTTWKISAKTSSVNCWGARTRTALVAVAPDARPEGPVACECAEATEMVAGAPTPATAVPTTGAPMIGAAATAG